jgi:hypothetical protein
MKSQRFPCRRPQSDRVQKFCGQSVTITCPVKPSKKTGSKASGPASRFAIISLNRAIIVFRMVWASLISAKSGSSSPQMIGSHSEGRINSGPRRCRSEIHRGQTAPCNSQAHCQRQRIHREAQGRLGDHGRLLNLLALRIRLTGCSPDSVVLTCGTCVSRRCRVIVNGRSFRE